MSLGTHRDEGKDKSAAGRPSTEAPQSPCAPRGHREAFIDQREGLLRDLLGCQQEGEQIGQLLRFVAAVSNFRLRDAVAFNPTNVEEAALPQVHLLKTTIAKWVKVAATGAEELFDTPEAQREYMERLESQFDDMRYELIQGDRDECLPLVHRLCSRIESVTERLHGECGELIGGGSGENLRRMAADLRTYSERFFATGTETPSAIEVHFSKPGVPSTSVPLKNFFDRLNSETAALYRALSDDTPSSHGSFSSPKN